MVPIGEDVTERSHLIPARIEVNRYVRKKYAWLATTKYGDHVPLNRMEGILKRQGVHLAKQTMWDMLVRLRSAGPAPDARRAPPG